jgi:hypothetical protein
MRYLLFLLCALIVVSADARNPRGLTRPSGSGAVLSGAANVSASGSATLGPFGAGTWVNVTPPGVDLINGSCGNFGTETVQTDTSNPGTMYTEFNCQGIWKSTDYGATWAGPINTGTGASQVTDCAGGITISPNPTPGGPATLYESCIRGSGIGFWKSIDGGVNWINYSVVPPMPVTQDVYPPQVDPYNPNHLLMTGHEQDFLLQSFDGGHTWSSVTLNAGMLGDSIDTAFAFFINTGNSTTTANTWLWIHQITGGVYGTWRTTNGGTTWTKVDNGEHPHGISQIYQPDTSGVVYMAQQYSSLGDGILRSTNYGATWSHVGVATAQTVVSGTPNNIYALFGFACGPNCFIDPAFEVTTPPGTGTWTSPGTPTAMGGAGGAGQIAVANNGVNNILVSSAWNAGLWRYVEPSSISAGNWYNATPAGIDLVNGSCGNFGSKTAQIDPTHPGFVYTEYDCQGVWRSGDYGSTWSLINTGTNGSTVTDCGSEGFTVVPINSSTQPTIYQACVRGAGCGLWKSTNGGVDWTLINVTAVGAGCGNQQFYPPVADPYDPTHLLMNTHAGNVLLQSTDSGSTWSTVTIAGGMIQSGGTAGIHFINTGSSSTTRTTWLWMASESGGGIGTWRTTNSGTSWTQVDSGEHVNGDTGTQQYQVGTTGTIYIASHYSSHGDGVLMSTDYGVTWAHVGLNQPEGSVIGSSKNLYAMYGWACGAGCSVSPALERAVNPGTGTWTSPGTPGGMTQGPANLAVANNGTNNIVFAAGYNAGLWRYIEP